MTGNRKTVLPVLGVPVESKALKGLDSLLSIAQMPGGVPVGTLAIGKRGAINAALLQPRFWARNIRRFAKPCGNSIESDEKRFGHSRSGWAPLPGAKKLKKKAGKR